MFRIYGIVFMIAAALVLANAANAEPATSPAATISAIYKIYQTQNEPKLPAGTYSPRLQTLIEADEKNTPEGEVGALDFDVIVNGQDWKLSELSVKEVSRRGDRARVVATFKNFDRASEIAFDLIANKDRWLIDEVSSLKEPRWTMSNILQQQPGAPGGKK